MELKTNGVALAVLVGILMASGQLLFKAGSKSISFESPMLLVQSLVSSPIILTAISVYGLTILLWILALQTLPLSTAYPITALAFIVVPVLSHFTFNEPYSFNQLLGGALIFLGIVITTIK